jgi:glycosyltransferase involved in cell wall biosynthesis
VMSSISREREQIAPLYDLVCVSHLCWDFVYQRPQHLLSRCARERRVFFVEEPIYEEVERPYLHVHQPEAGLWVAVPHIPASVCEEEAYAFQRKMLDGLLVNYTVRDYVLWYYTPMALPFTDHLEPLAIVYDCMDELSAFRFAPSGMKQREAHLLHYADLVFTGGQSLYEAKRQQHAHVYAFPSSVDVAHFAQARAIIQDPADQACISQPRVGFYGVIDERIDLGLLAAIADAQPDWQLVLLGPVTKIDSNALPRRENIHYLGAKRYVELPAYLAGWNVAIMPFALNEATRYISPTKTLEYLAAGKPVVSTPIRDVVSPYGEQKLVSITESAGYFYSRRKKSDGRGA